MRHFSPRPVLTLCACGIAASVSYATQPPDVVQSDSASNTAMGSSALLDLTTGVSNTAAGEDALRSNETGEGNSAFGSGTLVENTTGNSNSAFGFGALSRNTIGYNNTGVGTAALNVNSTGYWETAVGVDALFSNVSGAYNSAFGGAALKANQTGIENTALGVNALNSNKHGNGNTSVGVNALEFNTIGNNNTAMGFQALHGATGSGNIAIGLSAGSNVTTGSNNIHIGAAGSSADSGKIRIGTQGTQTGTSIAGISGTHITGAAVYITTSGQLGVLASSERYKMAVATMGSGSRKLTELRPVTFRLKSDPKGQTQYGLIAEEVAKVYPELVIRNEAGQAEGVRYEELTPMLLNEVQRQQSELGDVRHQLAKLQKLVRTLKAQIR